MTNDQFPMINKSPNSKLFNIFGFKRFIWILSLGFWILGLGFFGAFALTFGDLPPDFSLPNLAGENISLSQYLSKEVVLISFFASWSKPCQEEIKFLKELQEKYPETSLKIFGISFDRKTKDLEAFVKNNTIPFAILRDKKLTTLDDFQILIIPTLLVIDSSGVLKNIYIDFDENVNTAITQELEELFPPKNHFLQN